MVHLSPCNCIPKSSQGSSIFLQLLIKNELNVTFLAITPHCFGQISFKSCISTVQELKKFQLLGRKMFMCFEAYLMQRVYTWYTDKKHTHICNILFFSKNIVEVHCEGTQIRAKHHSRKSFLEAHLQTKKSSV